MLASIPLFLSYLDMGMKMGGGEEKKCRKKKRRGGGKEMKKKVLERVNDIDKFPIRVIRKGVWLL